MREPQGRFQAFFVGKAKDFFTIIFFCRLLGPLRPFPQRKRISIHKVALGGYRFLRCFLFKYLFYRSGVRTYSIINYDVTGININYGYK